MNLEALAERIKNCDWNGSGCTAKFYVIQDIGHKVFRSERERDYSYKQQKIASFMGMGPKCHSRFMIPCTHTPGLVWYGFISEVAPELMNHPSRSLLADEVNKFTDKFRDVFSFNDCHWGNLGVLNGKVVCIDFGHPDYNHTVYRRKRVH